MIGMIQKANKSKSGKTLSIQVDDVWYTSKNWELEFAAGRRIIFEPSTQNFPDGGSCEWLNDYVFEDAQTTPAAQAFNQAHQDQPPPLGQPGPPTATPEQVRAQAQAHRTQPNKGALIGALALTKSITGQKEQVWEAFLYFYHKMDNFDPTAN